MSERSGSAFWTIAPGEGVIRPTPVAEPGPDELLVRTLYTGISRGTESLVWNGRVPASEAARMQAPFQAGRFPAPVKYGYASVGVVEAGAPAWLGREVFCLYPHQSLYCVPATAAIPLPPGLPAGRAVLAANTETALNACWDAEPRAGERISVIGAGVVGTLTAALCQALPGTEVELIDINPARQALAGELGIDFARPEAARRDNDRVIHASASDAGLRLGLDIAGPEATIVELSWFGDDPVSLPLGEAFHSQRLTLRASQVGRIPPAMAPRWDHRRRLEKALQLLATHPAWESLIDGETDFTDLPRAMDAIVNGHGLCQRVRYPE